MQFAEVAAQLSQEGQISRMTRLPKLLQLAVLLDHYKEAMALPGPMWVQRSLVRPLSALGRARGYKATLN